MAMTAEQKERATTIRRLKLIAKRQYEKILVGVERNTYSVQAAIENSAFIKENMSAIVSLAFNSEDDVHKWFSISSEEAQGRSLNAARADKVRDCLGNYRILEHSLTQVARTEFYNDVTLEQVEQGWLDLYAAYPNMQIDMRRRRVNIPTAAQVFDGVVHGPFFVTILVGRFNSEELRQSYVVTIDEEKLEKDKQADAAAQAAAPDSVTLPRRWQNTRDCHPHVSGNRLCEGEGLVFIKDAWQSFRLADAVLIIQTVLETYFPSTAYRHPSPRFYCNGCSNQVLIEGSTTCPTCRSRNCSNCHFNCVSCNADGCSRCFRRCSSEDCDKRLCTECCVFCNCCGNALCETCALTNPDNSTSCSNCSFNCCSCGTATVWRYTYSCQGCHGRYCRACANSVKCVSCLEATLTTSNN